MPTNALSGRSAYLRFSSASSQTTAQAQMAELRNFTLRVNGATIDVTNHDSSGWEENLVGIRNWDWDADCNWLSTGTAQGALRQSLIDADANIFVTFKFTTSNTAKKFQGKTRLTGFEQSAPTDAEVLGRFSGRGNGAIVRTA